MISHPLQAVDDLARLALVDAQVDGLGVASSNLGFDGGVGFGRGDHELCREGLRGLLRQALAQPFALSDGWGSGVGPGAAAAAAASSAGSSAGASTAAGTAAGTGPGALSCWWHGGPEE